MLFSTPIQSGQKNIFADYIQMRVIAEITVSLVKQIIMTFLIQLLAPLILVLSKNYLFLSFNKEQFFFKPIVDSQIMFRFTQSPRIISMINF